MENFTQHSQAARREESPQAPGQASRRFTIVALALLALAVALVFANGLGGVFVSDDEFTIVRNPSLHTLAGSLTPSATGRGVTSDGRPLVNFSLAINYALGGYDPYGYRVFNILVHALAAWTLFGLARRTLALEKFSGDVRENAPRLALAIALLWAVHPLQTNAVTYIVQRAESLAALFYLIALYCLARGGREDAPRGWLGLGVACAFFGVACKEAVATLPFAALLYDRTFLAGSMLGALKKRRSFYLGLAASWLPLAWFMAASGARGNTVGFSIKHTAWEYLQTQGWAIAHYLKLAVWPSDLVLDYGTVTVTGAKAALPGALVLLLLALTIYGLFRRPVTAFPGALFFLHLAPTSSFIPVLTTVCEYRMYLPLAPLASLAVVGVWTLTRKLAAPDKRFPRFLPALLLAIAVAGFSWATVARNRLFHDEVAMFEDIAAKAPENHRSALYLAQLYFDRGRYAEAAEIFRSREQLDPKDARLKAALGMSLLAQGLTLEALGPLSKAASLSPGDPVIIVALSSALLGLGRADQALGLLERAEEASPRDPGLMLNKGTALMLLGRPLDAVDAYRRGLSGGLATGRARENLINALRDAEGTLK